MRKATSAAHARVVSEWYVSERYLVYFVIATLNHIGPIYTKPYLCDKLAVQQTLLQTHYCKRYTRVYAIYVICIGQ